MNESTHDFFREVTVRICGNLDIQRAMEQTFAYLERFMPLDALGLVYVDMEHQTIRPVSWVVGPGDHLFPEGGPGEMILRDDVVDYFTRNKKCESGITRINRPEERPKEVVRDFPYLQDFSVMNLYLSIDGHAVGKLTLAARGTDRYTEGHAHLLRSVHEPIAIAMSNARRYLELKRVRDLLAEDNRALQADLKRATGIEVVGADFGLKTVMEQVSRIAPANSPALLLGETGTGKDVVAHAIHMSSPRRTGPMITMQCGAIPESLLDSELFGHEKGAFTGATERKRGRFERADGGTLFLDEIGELSPEAQVKLLRVIQEKKFERVGGTRTIATDTRVIAATHRDLEEMVRRGRFREDLWYRLNVLPIRIPPLRLRREDIPSLVHHFIERKARELNRAITPRIRPGDMERLVAYDWPGNVRELQNILERAIILAKSDWLVFPPLGRRLRDAKPEPDDTSGPVMTMDQAMADHIEQVLKRTNGQVAGSGGAAELLGLNPSTLRFRMKKLGIL